MIFLIADCNLKTSSKILYSQFTLIDVVLFCSIGSLGEGNSEAQVSNVVVNRAILTETTNGVRIKTWQVSIGLCYYLHYK